MDPLIWYSALLSSEVHFQLTAHVCCSGNPQHVAASLFPACRRFLCWAPSGASMVCAETQPVLKLEWKTLLSAHDFSSSCWLPEKAKSWEAELAIPPKPPCVTQSCNTSRPRNVQENRSCGESNNSFFPLERHKDCASSHEEWFELGPYFSFQL